MLCCAILGHSPMRFAWGFDEETEECCKLKAKMMRVLTAMQKDGVSQYAVACDCGVGLYAAEIINSLRENDPSLELYCILPFEDQATKWAPYLRDRYFAMLEKCTLISTISTHEIADAQLHAYRRMIRIADIVLAVYDPKSDRNDEVDKAVKYAVGKGKKMVYIDPDTFQIRLE